MPCAKGNGKMLSVPQLKVKQTSALSINVSGDIEINDQLLSVSVVSLVFFSWDGHITFDLKRIFSFDLLYVSNRIFPDHFTKGQG